MAITKLDRHMSPFGKETEEAHFNSKGRKHQEETSPDAPLMLPLDIKIGMVEIENDVGRMRHHLWETRKKTKPMNAIRPHSIIQHLLLTLCHLHPFVWGHLRDFPFSDTDDEFQTHSE